MKKNCWEFKNCGREPGGKNAKELGVCVAATMEKAGGVHGGKMGGRACWVIAGTLCGGKVQGTYASKMGNCIKCDFYHSVMDEEGADFLYGEKILRIIKS